MDDKIKQLLYLNHIREQDYEEIVYKTILMGIFESICKEIKRQNTKVEELSRFRRNKDHLFVTKKIVERYAGCRLSEEEYDLMYQLLRAFFRKKDFREDIPITIKRNLLESQDYKCPFCKRTINLTNSHLDHIIPWDFVGDELDNNYQMLCVRCNERKGTSAYFGLSMLFMNTEGIPE